VKQRYSETQRPRGKASGFIGEGAEITEESRPLKCTFFVHQLPK